MSSAIQKRARGVSVKRPSRSSAAANATEWTSTSRPPPNTPATSEKTRATSPSERTSQSITSGLETLSARSRTFFSIRSPWKVNASCAPSSASRFAIAQAIERRLATPRTRPRFPSNRIAPGPYTGCGTLDALRRFVPLLAVVAALTAVAPTFAKLQPIKRNFGEVTLPRLRAGTLKIPAGHSDGRVRVIVGLEQPPLPAVFGRSAKRASEHRLNVASASSRAYMAQLTRLQNAAAAQLKMAIPAIQLQRRFQILLDGITVSVPNRSMPRLVRLPFVTKVYPSLTYTVETNESPQIIQA